MTILLFLALDIITLQKILALEIIILQPVLAYQIITLHPIQRYANISDMLFDQKSPVQREALFPRWHTQTHTDTTHGHRDLETESAQCANSVKET